MPRYSDQGIGCEEKMMPTNKVFIVHGRNLNARNEIRKFLTCLKLEPIDWTQASALTGKGAPTTLEIVKAGIDAAQSTVVLMTGDDLAQLRPEYGQETLTPQPRPNVIFEAGWALAIGGPQRTILLKFGALRDFSDLSGLSFVELDNSQEQREALVQRLRNAGHIIKKTGLSYLNKASGDFELQDEPDECNPDILLRGDFTQFIVDSSLSHSVSTLDLEKEMLAYLQAGSTPTLKFNYLGALGAQNWLSLCEDPRYGHIEFESAFSQIVNDMINAAGIEGKRVDVVSLGPGDGKLDLKLLTAIQGNATIAHYYPLDLSIELLQSAVNNVVRADWLNKNFRIKAIHGDFTSLIRYKPIYSFDPALNFISLIGYTFGNHHEGELLGKLREAMEPADLLLVDARLHREGAHTGAKPTKEQTAEITRSYNHVLNNRFAFGPLEAMTTADFLQTTFLYDVNRLHTVVPDALNIVTYVKELHTKLRKTGTKLHRRRLELAVTTIYEINSLTTWLNDRGFDVIWSRPVMGTAFILLRKTAD